jgi:hypothetical protein
LDRFTFIARRNSIVLRPAWLAHDAHLTRFRDKGYSVLTYDYHLPPPLRLQAVATLLAVALKDWPGKRFGYRFAPPGAHRGGKGLEEAQGERGGG